LDNLVTKNVFIDSSIYISRNFQFNDRLLGRIAWLASEGFVKLFISEIVIKEVNRKIELSLKEAETSLNSLKNKCRILRNVPDYKPIFDTSSLAAANDKIKNNFEDFIKETKSKVLSLEEVSVGQLVKNYFNHNPPFSEGKKDEFPDAINLLAIEDWCIKNNQEMYIISSDNDLKQYCAQKEFLHFLGSIEGFLDKVTSSNGYKYNFIKHLFNISYEDVEARIKEDFEELGFTLENEEGDVESIEAYSVEFEDEDEINITEIDDDVAVLTFEARVWFNADVTYNDYENSPFDKEEGEYIYINAAELHVAEYDVLIPVTLKAKFDIPNEQFKITECIVNEDNDVPVTLFAEDYR
jgi:hypothetical protein